MKRSLRLTVVAIAVVITCIGLFLVGFQLFQRIREHQQGQSAMQGLVVDQDAQPLSGVVLTFNTWTRRMYLPIAFSPVRTINKRITATTDSRGVFRFNYPWGNLTFMAASKPGYRQDAPDRPSMWWPYGISSTQQWTLHLVSEALMRSNQVVHYALDSVPFPTNGNLCITLANGQVCEAAEEADIVFRWRRLAATPAHGEYGKFIIQASKGGIWLWPPERLFAPRENYENGMAFTFGPEKMRAYMKFHRAELFLKSRAGALYARLYAQMNTERGTLSMRARVNKSGTRYVGEQCESYVIGVYGSLSDLLGNTDFPWWAQLPDSAQVLMNSNRIRALVNQDDRFLTMHRYFAGHYHTPPDLLTEMVSGQFAKDFYIPKFLAKNLNAPPAVHQRLATNTIQWIARDSKATVEMPQDLKHFLLSND